MSEGLRLSDSLLLPIDAVTQTFAVIGRRSSGKSYLSGLLAEQMIDIGAQIIILDPVGNLWGLRLMKDGKTKGKDIFIMGGAHGDVPISKDSGRRLARLLVEKPVSALIDTSEFREGERKRFAADFADEFFHLKKTQNAAVHLFIEEAQLFCLSDDTDILTRDGWRTRKNLSLGDEVVCFDPTTETYTYGPIQRVIVRQYDGEMIQLKTRSLDCLVTPDHRVLLQRIQRGNGGRSGKKYPWSFCEAHKVPTCIGIPIGGAPIGTGVPGLTTTDARILGWIITDGNIHDKAQNNRKIVLEQSIATIKGGVRIAQLMDETLQTIPGVTRYQRPARKTTSKGRLRNHAASIRWYLGGESSEKFLKLLGDSVHRIPRLLIEHGSSDQLKALLDGLLEGDGTCGRKKQWIQFYPGLNEGLADDFQEVALRLNFSTFKHYEESIGQWQVRFAAIRKTHWVRKPQRQKYSGPVWDITVPTGAFVARRRGRVFTTGNCPQNPRPGKGEGFSEMEMLGAFERIIRLGRNYGIGATLISQRPQSINKEVLNQTECLCVLQVNGRHEREALQKWVEEHGATDRALVGELPGLAQGEGFVWSPAWLRIFKRMHFAQKVTFDSTATPKVGVKTKATTLTKMDVESLKADLQQVIEKAAKTDPKALQKRIDELEGELKKARTPAAAPTPAAKVERVDRELLYKAQQQEIDRIIRTEIRPHIVQLFHNSINIAVGKLEEAKTTLFTSKGLLDGLGAWKVNHISDAAKKDIDKAITTQSVPQAVQTRTAPRRDWFDEIAADIRRDEALKKSKVNGAAPLKGPEQRILNAIAWFEAIGIPQPDQNAVAFIAGYSFKSSSYTVPRSVLSRIKAIEYTGDGRIMLSDAGRELADIANIPQTNDALLKAVSAKLGGPERRLLSVLVEEWPKDISSQELANRANYSEKSSSFTVPRSRLSSLGLIQFPAPGRVRARDILFPKGRSL